MSGVVGAPAVIEVRDLHKSFLIPSVRRDTLREHAFDFFRPRRTEQLDVLRSVTFQVHRGEAIGIMGRNGSGKSTLLKILAGIYAPDVGSVDVRGTLTPVLELGVGWNGKLDGIDNASLMGTALGLTLQELKAALPGILAFAELERFAAMPLKHYSSGMAARLAYAVAFAAAGDILLLDEIFAVGDAAFRARCEECYPALRARGCTILLVSHEVETIRRFCDRAILVEGGRVVMDGSAREVTDAYLQLLTATS